MDMATTDDEAAPKGTSSHPALVRFRETLDKLKGTNSIPPVSFVRQKQQEMQRRRLELQEEVDGMKDEDGSDSMEEDIAAAPA